MPPELTPDQQPNATDAYVASEAQITAAFKDGFENGSPTDAPARPAAASEGKPAAAADEAHAPAAAPAEPEAPIEDPFGSLPAAVRDVLAKVPRLEHETRSAVGRVGALQRQNEELRRELDGLRGGRLVTAATASAAAPAPSAAPRSGAYEYVREQLPDVAEAISEAIERRLGPAAPAADSSAAAPAPAAAQTSATPPVSAEDVAEAQLLAAERPTWAHDLYSTDFQLWLHTQPEAMRHEVMSTSKAIVLDRAFRQFDTYKAQVAASAQRRTAEAGDTTQRRAHRAAAAVQPPGLGGGRPPGVASPSTKSAFQAGFEEG